MKILHSLFFWDGLISANLSLPFPLFFFNFISARCLTKQFDRDRVIRLAQVELRISISHTWTKPKAIGPVLLMTESAELRTACDSIASIVTNACQLCSNVSSPL